MYIDQLNAAMVSGCPKDRKFVLAVVIFCHINFCQDRKRPLRLVEFTPANKRAASVKSPKNDARVA